MLRSRKVLVGASRSQHHVDVSRPALLVLIAALLGALPACYGLKSLASESESEHKVRGTVEAVVGTFVGQLSKGHLHKSTDEYALARALLERGSDSFSDFVVNEMFPPDAACRWDWSNMQCEPCGQCRRASYSEMVQGRKNESRWCAPRPRTEQAIGQTCPDPAMTATPSGVEAAMTSGRLGKRLHRAVLKFVELELLAPSNSSCYFDVTRVRCEPSTMCTMDYQKGDLTPHQACRLISQPSMTSTTPSCSWNAKRMRCDAVGACRPEIWRWALHSLRRKVALLHKALLVVAKVCVQASQSSGHAIEFQVWTLLRAVKMLGQHIRVLAIPLGEDFAVTARKFARSVKQRSHLMRDAMSNLPFLVTYWREMLHNFCVMSLEPKVASSFSSCLAVCATVRLKVTNLLLGMRHGIQKMNPQALGQHCKTVFNSISSRKLSRETFKAMVQDALADTVQVQQDLKQTAVAAVKVPFQRASLTAAAAWTLLKTMCMKSLQALRTARACPHEHNPQRGAEFSGARLLMLDSGRVGTASRARKTLVTWSSSVSLALRQGVNVVKEGMVRMGLLLQVVYRAGKRAQRDLAAGLVAELETVDILLGNVDLCVAIPEEEQRMVRMWKFYSPWTAAKTASFLHGRILDQLMV